MPTEIPDPDLPASRPDPLEPRRRGPLQRRPPMWAALMTGAFAVLSAAPLRVRPIVMTVLTTVVGMLPLALNHAEGGELMNPMAVAVIGGLTLSTLLTLFVVPCLYLMLTGLADRMQRRLLVGGAGG